MDATGSVILQGCNQETEPPLEFNARYFYNVTQGDIDSTADLIIQIPETILHQDLIVVNSKYGKLEYGDHYVLQNGGNEILVKREYVDLEVGMIIEIYTYKLAGT
jgi:hypothetical protein